MTVKFNNKCTFPRLNATLFEAVAFNLGQICNTIGYMEDWVEPGWERQGSHEQT